MRSRVKFSGSATSPTAVSSTTGSPDRYIGRRVWTLLRGDRLTIECNRKVIVTHPVKTDYLDAVSRDN